MEFCNVPQISLAYVYKQNKINAHLISIYKRVRPKNLSILCSKFVIAKDEESN